jgi:hypothetical protein
LEHSAESEERGVPEMTIKPRVPSTSEEIYQILMSYGVPSDKALECGNKLIKPYSVLLDYAVKIGYRVD